MDQTYPPWASTSRASDTTELAAHALASVDQDDPRYPVLYSHVCYQLGRQTLHGVNIEVDEPLPSWEVDVVLDTCEFAAGLRHRKSVQENARKAKRQGSTDEYHLLVRYLNQGAMAPKLRGARSRGTGRRPRATTRNRTSSSSSDDPAPSRRPFVSAAYTSLLSNRFPSAAWTEVSP